MIEEYAFSITKQNKALNLQDIIIDSIDSSSCPLLNYLILIGKLYLWDCRRKRFLPYIDGFKSKLKISITKQKNTFIQRTKTYLHFITNGRRIFFLKVSFVLFCKSNWLRC